MRGPIPPLLEYVFMTCYVVKHRINYLYPNMNIKTNELRKINKKEF